VPKKIELVLPVPPSVNRIWKRGKHGNVYLDPKVEPFYLLAKKAAMEAKAHRIPFPKDVPVKVTMKWYRATKTGDLDNRAKIIGDSLNGVVWADDKQIIEWHLYRYESPKKGRVELTIEEAQ